MALNASLTTINELTELLSDLQRRSESLTTELAAVRQQLTAVQLTLQLVKGEQPTNIGFRELSATDRNQVDDNGQPMLVPVVANGWKEKLRGLKHLEALRRIAQGNGGLVKVTEARNIMISAGLITGKPRNATSHLYNIMDNSPLFEKHAPGTYRLVENNNQIDDPDLRP